MLNAEYWNNRYNESQTGWDIGEPSRPLVEYINQLTDKDIKVLFPGAGHAYDAEYMFNLGFKNVYVADFAQTAADNFFKRVSGFPEDQFIVGDFFEIKEAFDLIIEQTFFCALNPDLRDSYAKHMSQIINPKGKLAGVLFKFPLTEKGPPYGGSEEEYRNRFTKHFQIKSLEECYNSIPPRQGNEVFFILEKEEA
jgi:hypothetical protein